MVFQDHFSGRAAAYARARPHYPAGLFTQLAERAPRRTLAWDAATGNGQAAVGLAPHFEQIIASDPSQAQLAQAPTTPGIRWVQAAERIPELQSGTVDLVTVAQAAHWLDLEVFYAEVRRVLAPGGLFALWGYGLSHITPEIDALVGRFYSETVGPFWPEGRVLLDRGYRDLPFPFEEIALAPPLMAHDWTLDDFLGYLRTWSAVARYANHHGDDPVTSLAENLAPLWGDPSRARRVEWPLFLRAGT